MPAVTGAAPALPRPGRPLGVGVLGCADIALRRFLPALQGACGARLVAVASRDPARAAAVAGRFGCAAHDYAGLLDSSDVEAVYLPLPNHLHEAWAIAALERGKHVLCEKPVGLTPESVGRVLAAAGRGGRLLFENLQYLQHPQHGAVRALLAAGAIGEVTGLDCTFHFPGPAPGDFRLDPARGGGAVNDLARYPLSAAGLLLAGELREITGCHVRRRGGLDLSMAATAATTAGERLTFSIAFGQPYRSCYQVLGTQGSALLDRAFTPPPDHACRLEVRRRGEVDHLALPAADQFRLTIEHVAGLVAAGGPFEREHARARRLADLVQRFLAAATVEEVPP